MLQIYFKANDWSVEKIFKGITECTLAKSSKQERKTFKN